MQLYLKISILLWMCWATLLPAQNYDFANYRPLESKGPIPKDVTSASSIKYREDLKKISEKDTRREAKAKKRFYLESNFLLDDLLRSGYVLFNDPLSEYVTAVADNLLKDDPNLRKKLSFYIMRSSDVNAFATDQGAVLVTTGLLSQIENEAQLAFILAHEITHFQRKHTLNLYVEVETIDKATSKNYVFKKSTFDKEIIKQSYSRDLETQADKEGLERFLKSNYDLSSLDGVFDVLAYSELPFDDRHFQIDYFENDYLKFPKAYNKTDVKAISPIQEDADDSNSSHPNYKKRRETMASVISSSTNNGRVKFILPEARFREMQEMARFEVPLLSLHQEEYYRAIYEAWLSLANHPDNFYLQKSMLKGMYTACKYRNNGLSYQTAVDSIEGELQGLVYFFEKLSNPEFNVLVLREAWRLHQINPQDSEVAFMAKDALNELFFYHVSDLNGFSKEKMPLAVEEMPPPELPKEEAPKTTEKPKEKSKFDKIREKKADPVQEKAALGLMKHALAPYLDNSEFQDEAKKAQENIKKRKDRKAYNETEKGRSEWRKKQAHNRKKGQRLGVSQLVVVNPFYLNLDARKSNAIQYEKSENSQSFFTELLKDNAKKAGLKLTLLDVEHLKATDIEKFNDIALLNQWFAQQINFEDLSITPGFRQEAINALAQKYNTKQFCWTGVISMREKKGLLPYVGLLFGPVMVPFVAAYALKKEYDCLYYNIVYNVETGGYTTVKFEYFNTADSKTLLNLHTYDAFLQIKSK